MVKSTRRLLGAVIVLVLLVPAAATAATVHIRVEGAKRTLIGRAEVKTPAGTVGKGANQCAGATVLGALDVAAKGRWGGAWNADFADYLIATIRGETPKSPSYWQLWKNHEIASAGVCQTKVRNGDDLLFFVSRCDYDPKTTNCSNVEPMPLEVRAPARATAGKAFTVKVVWFDGGGKATALAGATLRGGGRTVKTDKKGNARLTFANPGRVSLQATKATFVRSAPDVVSVRKP